MSGSITYSFSDELHVTLCSARLKQLRPILMSVTCQQVLKQQCKISYCDFLKKIKEI